MARTRVLECVFTKLEHFALRFVSSEMISACAPLKRTPRSIDGQVLSVVGIKSVVVFHPFCLSVSQSIALSPSLPPIAAPRQSIERKHVFLVSFNRLG